MNPSATTLSVESDLQRARSLDGIPQVDLVTSLKKASVMGKRAGAMIREIWELRRGPGGLHPNEYFYYGLCADDLGSDQKRRFVGKTVQNRLHHNCNDTRWRAVADDKDLFYATMRGHGFAVPETVAAFRASPAAWPGMTLHSREELLSLLRQASEYPLFAKPVQGIYSVGALSLWAYEAGDDSVVLRSGERIAAAQCADYICQGPKHGYLVQRLLRAHPRLARSFGATALPTVRLLVGLSDDGPSILSAVCKIPAAGNIADNFWRQGNMLGAIDLDSGAVFRVISGTGLDSFEHAEHPDTGLPIRGMVLPDWEQATRLCLRAASTLPGIRTQSWDVALTDSGPTLIETNWGGDLNLHQLAHRRGILQEAYVEHLRGCGCKVNI